MFQTKIQHLIFITRNPLGELSDLNFNIIELSIEYKSINKL